MAKIIWKLASEDDPIYNGGLVISSHNLPEDEPVDPRERYPDMQNLSVDPAEAALKAIRTVKGKRKKE